MFYDAKYSIKFHNQAEDTVILKDPNEDAKFDARMLAKTPMDIEVILDIIMKYLAFEDLKRCRLVNRKFNVAANTLLRKIGICVLRNPDCRCSKTSKLEETVTQQLINMLPGKFVLRTPYNCFCHWQMKKLTSMLASYSRYIHELTIDGLNLQHLEYMKFDNMGFLSKLKIDSNIKFTIPLQKMVKLTSLDLAKNCTINIENQEKKLIVTHLRLSNVTFIPYKNEPIVLNDYFKFTNTKHLDLTFSDCVVEVKLCSKINFDYLSFCGVRITNPSSINGYVDVLNMNWVNTIEFINFSNVTVNEVKAICNLKRIHLLPNSVKKLNLTLLTNDDAMLDVFCQTYFPHLENLKFTCSNAMAFSSLFSKMCNMMKCIQFRSNEIVLTSIPSSVKKVMLKENAKIITDSPIEVDTLILNLYNLINTKITLTKISTINLVLHLSDILNSKEEVEFNTAGDFYFGPIFENSENKYFRRTNGVNCEISQLVFMKTLKDG